MSEQEPKALPAELQQLLRRAGAPVPPPGFDAAVLARVKSTLALPPLPPAAGAPGAAAAAGTKMGAWGVKVSLATLALGLASGALVGSRFSAEAPPSAPVIAAAPPAVETPVLAEPARQPSPAAPPAPAPAKRPPVQVAKPAPPPAGSRDVDLAEERSLIELARTSLGRREAARTLELLAEHARRFPSGQLSEERDSLWVQALVNVGDLPNARRRAQEFHLKYPDSMLRPSVDAATAHPGPPP